MTNKHILSALAIVLFPTAGIACEWHGANNFGIFGHMNMQAQPQNMSKIEENLTVEHVEEVTVVSGVTSSIDIQYMAPLRYQQIELEFAPSAEVTLLSDNKMNVTQLRGDIALEFQANIKGQHVIIINVSATENGIPHFSQQRIIVNAS